VSVVLGEQPRLARHHVVCRTADALALALGWMACAALVLIVALLTLEMLARTAFNHSFAFSWEYASYLLGVMIFGGLGWTLRTGGHIRVTVLESLLPAKVYRAIERLAGVVGAVLATVLAAAMVGMCKSSYMDQSRSFLATETLLYIPQVFMALGAVGFALQTWLRVYLLQAGKPVELKAARIDSAQSHL
jgi:TRAP-type C4-dicarboxylate transport system permease small subunit